MYSFSIFTVNYRTSSYFQLNLVATFSCLSGYTLTPLTRLFSLYLFFFIIFYDARIGFNDNLLNSPAMCFLKSVCFSFYLLVCHAPCVPLTTVTSSYIHCVFGSWIFGFWIRLCPVRFVAYFWTDFVPYLTSSVSLPLPFNKLH